MTRYRKILEMHFNGISQRTISTSVGNSRNTVSSIIKKAESLGLVDLSDTHTDQWLGGFLFPEK